jgi:hypothetical protein
MYPEMTFRGSKLGDKDAAGAPLKLAIGGKQTIMVLASPQDTVGVLSFRAASSGAAITAGQLLPPNVTVRGNSEGSAYLRILSPTTGQDLLFARTLIDVVSIASVDVRPKSYSNDLADMEFAADDTVHWVMFTGTGPTGARTEDMVVRLFDASGNRVADEGVFLGVSGPPLVLAGAQATWDTVTITASPGGASQGQLSIQTSDNVNRDQDIDIVTSVDQIIRVNAINATADPSTAIKIGDLHTYCFRALNGGRLVAGANWLFAASNAAIQPTSQAKNCVTLKGTATGAGLLTVSAELQPRTFNLSITQ